MNKAILIGRVTKDIDLKTTTTGKLIVTFTLAVKRDYKNASGNYDADFIDCVAYEQRAETISRYVRKGDRFGVVGSIMTRTYERQDGSTAYVTEIKVDSFEFLESKRTQATEDTADFEEVPFDDDDLFY